MNSQYVESLSENTILSANHPSRRFYRSSLADYSGYQAPYPDLASGTLDTQALYIRNATSTGVLSEGHYRDVLPSPYYWTGEKLPFRIPDTNSRLYYATESGHVKDDRVKKRRMPSIAQRRAANIRERRRMLNLNEAFDVLRRRVPTFNYERRLSRIETLRLAMGYISFMTQILNGKDPKDAKINVMKPGVAVKMDKELQENVENAE